MKNNLLVNLLIKINGRGNISKNKLINNKHRINELIEKINSFINYFIQLIINFLN